MKLSWSSSSRRRRLTRIIVCLSSSSLLVVRSSPIRSYVDNSSSCYSTLATTEKMLNVIAYHNQTKHHLDRYAKGPGMMDWSNQPDPFRSYGGTRTIKLEVGSIIDDDSPLMNEIFASKIPSKEVSLKSISRFFRDSLSISAWKSHGSSIWALRCNPSSGNLHPTEGFLIAGPISGCSTAPALYHYRSKDHFLEVRATIPPELWSRLSSALPKNAFLVGLSSIHWREAWKYGERAFRYCQHDVGHAIEALEISAACQGWQTHLLDFVSHSDLEYLLGIQGPQRGTLEEPECLLMITPNSDTVDIDLTRIQQEFPSTTELASIKVIGAPNLLSRREVEWQVINKVAIETRKDRTDVTSLMKKSNPIAIPVFLEDPSPLMRKMIHQRRSAVDFEEGDPLPLKQFYLFLESVHRPFPVFQSQQVHLAIFVHSVDGLESGLYFLVRNEEHFEELRHAMSSEHEWKKPDGCPDHLPFYRLLSDDLRELAKTISCHQDIASNGCFSLGMIARFERTIESKGSWYYRRLFWETGMIGQRLYLQAEASGIRGTGIGCFFDDAMHSVLGLRDFQYQSLYHFTVGYPLIDSRLTTLPAYDS